MIPSPKQRSFKYYLILAVSLGLPLGVFFVYAARVQTSFFPLIALGLLFNIVILSVFYRRLKAKRSAVMLQREEYFEKANLLKAELAADARAIGAFREKIVSYAQLKGFLEAMSAGLTLEETVSTLCRETGALFARPESTVILYLIDPHEGELAIAHASRQGRTVAVRLKRGDLFDRWVLKTLQPLCVEDAASDFRFDSDKAAAEGGRPVRSVLAVPLIVHRTLVGILRLDAPSGGVYTKEDLRFLRAVGDVAAVAIENAQLYDRVEDLAIRDSLTGLYLRRYLADRMAEELTRHLRRDKPMAFIMVDLDHFKKYNDTFGHPAGDILLRHVAHQLQEHFSSPGNLVCRYGGEEFCVLMAETGKEAAALQAQAFVERIAVQEISLRREKTRITVSAGVAAFPEDARMRDDLLQKADAALYAAKEAGRNRVCTA